MEKKEAKRKYHRFFWGQRQKQAKIQLYTIVRLPFWFLTDNNGPSSRTHAYLIEDFRYAHIYAYLWVYIAGDKPLNDDIGQPSGRQKTEDKTNRVCHATLSSRRRLWGSRVIGQSIYRSNSPMGSCLFVNCWFASGGTQWHAQWLPMSYPLPHYPSSTEM